MEQLVLALAIVCVGEASFSAPADCAAITHATLRRAERTGRTPLEQVRAYSGRHLDPRRVSQNRPWLANLRLDGAEPTGWPSHLRWRDYQGNWFRTLGLVRGVLRGEVRNPCPQADHWGGRMDTHRALRAGWTRVECEARTLNWFWSVRSAPN